VPVHKEVLEAARRICRDRGDWTFTPVEVVRALPFLNESTVRTHIVSRCCVNAPKNHPHRWPYFRRIGRGRYEILPPYRDSRSAVSAARTESRRARGDRAEMVAESRGGYQSKRAGWRDVIHAVLHREDGIYTAECLEIAVVTQGRTVDEVLANLREAIALHLEGEDLESMGLIPRRIEISYEIPLALSVPEA